MAPAGLLLRAHPSLTGVDHAIRFGYLKATSAHTKTDPIDVKIEYRFDPRADLESTVATLQTIGYYYCDVFVGGAGIDSADLEGLGLSGPSDGLIHFTEEPTR